MWRCWDTSSGSVGFGVGTKNIFIYMGIFITWPRAGRGKGRKNLPDLGITSIPQFWGDGGAGSSWEQRFSIVFRETPGKLQEESVGTTSLRFLYIFFWFLDSKNPVQPQAEQVPDGTFGILLECRDTKLQGDFLAFSVRFSQLRPPESLIPVSTAMTSFLWIKS